MLARQVISLVPGYRTALSSRPVNIFLANILLIAFSRYERTHPNFVSQARETEIFGLQFGRPSKFLQGLWASFLCPLGTKLGQVILPSVLASFVLFDVLRFSWNWFSLRLHSTKRNAGSVQTGLSFFDLRRKRTKSSQSTCIRDDLRFRSFSIALL